MSAVAMIEVGRLVIALKLVGHGLDGLLEGEAGFCWVFMHLLLLVLISSWPCRFNGFELDCLRTEESRGS